jgi:hypothetical protein
MSCSGLHSLTDENMARRDVLKHETLSGRGRRADRELQMTVLNFMFSMGEETAANTPSLGTPVAVCMSKLLQ